MKFLSVASIALALVLPAERAWSQAGEQTVDALYERGLYEMAPHWKGLGKTYDAAVFLHAEVQKAGKDYLAVWTDRELAAPEYFEKEKIYLSTRNRLVVDCKARSLGTTDVSYYASHFGKGAVVATVRTAVPEMLNVVPDSVEAQLVDRICAQPHHGRRRNNTKAGKPAAG